MDVSLPTHVMLKECEVVLNHVWQSHLARICESCMSGIVVYLNVIVG